ncbi:MAG: right-handed parallel beta-helix repeat-containing protein, partial [Ruminococcus sp.]
MKVIFKRSISVFITLVMLLSALLVMDITASAEEVSESDVISETDVKYVEVTVDITEETPPTEVFEKIQAVFNEARENATPTMQYKVILPPGVFKLDGTLSLYSNTFFDMNGATILRYHSREACILKCGRADDVSQGYEGFVNITVCNGTLDGWDKVMTPSTSNLVRMGHARNVLVENVNFVNNCNSHCLELGACKDVTVRNCVFKDQYQVNGKTAASEAIQIDGLHTKSFPLYESYDGTACRDIYVTGCTFENLTRGVGSHAVILDDNGYYDGIIVTNNTFKNISDYAVISLCWKNSKVNNNVITDCKNGVLIRSMRSDFRLMYDGETFTAPLKDYNVQLDSNSISTISSCVRLYGVNVPSAVNWTYDEVTGTVPAGDYGIYNVSVTNNTLKSTETALRLSHASSCKVLKNKVYVSGATTGLSGIYVCDSSVSNIISHNTVENSNGKSMKGGILFSGACKKNSVYNNTVKGNIQNGIFLYNGANSCKVNQNTVSGTKANGIYVYGCKNTVTNSNTVSVSTGNGIMLKSGSSSLGLEKNTVKGGTIGIGTSNATTANVTGNVVSGNDYGLYFNSSTVKTIKSNTVTGAKSNGMYMGNTTFSSLTSNSVSNSACSGIYAFGSTGKVQSNTIKNSKKYGMYFDTGSKNNVYKNSFSSNKKGDIYLYSKKGIVTTNLATPQNLTSKSCAFDKTNLSWKKSRNAEYYRIYRSTDNKNFTHIASTTSNVNTYRDKNLIPGKNYYYKIIPVVHSGKTYVVGSESNERRAKTGVVKAKIE